MAAQVLKNRKSGIVNQTDVAFVVVAGVAGGHDMAKTGRCGLAYKNTARYLKRVVLKCSQVPQPYIVTVPIRNNTTCLMKYETHLVMLPHELIY